MELTINRAERGHLLVAKSRISRSVEEVFDFFGNAHNLERVTPPFLRFEILTPDPVIMRQGALLDYRLNLRGIPLHWRSEITVWEPGRRFVDTQLKGPYRWWVHEHRFEPTDSGTLMTDRVEYGVPGGALVNFLLVGPDLRRIWEYREQEMRRALEPRQVGG
ncbi:MAG: SRPBCC family protein [Gemmatimonadetes bacterium]|uniref:SRPBCC family protein n=1 Tax=Candidatus Kutchimonas denitrificans TaxID=3056748 RepID=A0AAE4Z919_9BACT|nr:SRPBCC family protein [Gemmatimonadota bacterium]NIR76059.1 SRPBCC family protein [Candidatus Kutchimonas denitrificans]NIS00438.1 SRPBCC family protein [Gemmatimonadota bacterium]NIT66096.1 SRPBCC family protein [Gemmatimonadota bacterium]NIU54174.1 CDP-paratose 2-epimerase [Gemmatimonadota bacterium]